MVISSAAGYRRPMRGLWKAAGVIGWALAFVAGCICLAAAMIAQGGRTNGWLDLLTHFAPVWLMGAAAVMAFGWVFARGAARRVLVWLGIAGIVAAGALMIPEVTRPGSPRGDAGAPRQIRLIQFNAWDQNADPDAAAAWIDGQRPGVVTIDEVTPRLTRALIARGFHYRKGMTSTAIFSRGLRPRAPWSMPPPDWKIVPDLARASFDAPDGRGTFSVVAVHLTWPNLSAQWGKPEALARLLDGQPRDRLIIAGDFNLTPWSFTLARLDHRFGLERRDRAVFTWPARRRVGRRIVPLPPILPLDHVYAGQDWRTISVARGPSLGSDHHPIVVDLALAEPVTSAVAVPGP